MTLKLGIARGVQVLVLAFVLVSAPAHAIEVPPFTSPVVDQAQILTPAMNQQISNSLLQFQREYGPQIAVLIIPSLGGETIEAFSIRVADAWKLGTKKQDNGVLLLLAVQDRETRIEVGQGLEGDLPDIVAGRIIRDVMIPYFKQGQYDAGIVAGLSAIAGKLGGTLRNVPSYGSQSSPGSGLVTLLFFMLLFFVILPRFFWGRRRDYYEGDRNRRAKDFLTGMFWGSIFGRRRRDKKNDDDFWRGGGSDGSGGFGGGGGGGFSGGGASGKW